jgi:hypothetical protein
VRRAAVWDPDLAAWTAFAVLIAFQFLPACLRGLAPFWGDLSYIHHPWRALDAQLLQSGRLPLWNPYLYFGMPLAATMQDSAFYPGSVPFFIFSFADALLIFHLVHYWLSAALAFLWLRSLGLKRTSALGGAGLLCLGGVWLENRPFLNHLAVLSLTPALLLLARRPRLLAPALCAAFLAGYPPFFVGAAAASLALAILLAPRRDSGRRLGELSRGWLSAGVWAGALSGVLLLPAIELVSLSRRSGGVGLDEALQFGFAPSDLLQWISPMLLPWKAYDPGVEWWKSCFVGFIGLALSARGLAGLPRRKALLLGGWLAIVVLLTLGASNSISAALWAHLPPLKFVRYPGNLSYLAVPVLALCAAAGLDFTPRSLRPLAAAALLLELSAYGMGAFALAPKGLFASAGPLVRRMQAELEGHRYLLSPRALERDTGAGIEDWKHRLYGLTNDPFRLRAAGNFGEPLVPRSNYALMDWFYGARSAPAAAALFAWSDIRFLLTPGPLAPCAALIDSGRTLWQVYRSAVPAEPAYFFTETDGARIPEGLPQGPLPPLGRALEVSRAGDDRFFIAAESQEPGWVYVSEPLYPGWRVSLSTPRGEGSVSALPALAAFQKVHVPAGVWRLDFNYKPDAWRWGLILTLISGAALMWRGWRFAARDPA